MNGTPSAYRLWSLVVINSLVFMYPIWLKLLSGFERLSWKSFFIGLVESYGYGWYFTLIWVPIYNFAISRQAKAPVAGSSSGWH